jgi:hypothetical protein
VTALNDLGIDTIEAVGSYKGESEKSIVVSYNDYSYDQVTALAKLYNQESILMVSNKSHAHLLFMNPLSTMELGTMKEVSKEYAMTKEAYTFVPSTNTYFLAE